jgi:DNA-binding transcriptional LysR family regulator
MLAGGGSACVERGRVDVGFAVAWRSEGDEGFEIEPVALDVVVASHGLPARRKPVGSGVATDLSVTLRHEQGDLTRRYPITPDGQNRLGFDVPNFDFISHNRA